jgi:hypothetical protein
MTRRSRRRIVAVEGGELRFPFQSRRPGRPLHDVVIGPPWGAAEPITPLDISWSGPDDAPTSSADSWLVLFERPRRRPADGADPDLRSTSVPVTAADAALRLCDVIAAWRAADRELAGLTDADPEWSRVHAELVGLRALHHRLFDMRAEHRTPDREWTSVRYVELARAWLMSTAPRPVTA